EKARCNLTIASLPRFAALLVSKHRFLVDVASAHIEWNAVGNCAGEMHTDRRARRRGGPTGRAPHSGTDLAAAWQNQETARAPLRYQRAEQDAYFQHGEPEGAMGAPVGPPAISTASCWQRVRQENSVRGGHGLRRRTRHVTAGTGSSAR